MEQALRYPALRTERPSWTRNGQYRHGERTKAGDYGAAGVQRVAQDAPRWPDMNLAAEYKSEAPC
jgi:hypothetical protein